MDQAQAIFLESDSRNEKTSEIGGFEMRGSEQTDAQLYETESEIG